MMSLSDFIPDKAIAPAARYKALFSNIKACRESNIFITVPLYQDDNTKETVDAEYAEKKIKQNKWDDEQWNPHEQIMGDSTLFGVSFCCLQTTFQASSLEEALYLHDQVVVLCPILMALTAATPFFHGKISDFDARWQALSMSVDERSPYERGMTDEAEEYPGYQKRRLKRNRFSSV